MFSSAYDWEQIFRPAALALFNGTPMPDGFYSPTWVLFPLIPFALLPYETGRTLMLLCAVTSFAYVAYRMGANKIGIIAFLLSPLVIISLFQGNVEWLVLLGLVTAPPIGILLMLVKPQMTIIAILFLAWRAWKGNRVIRWFFLPAFAIAAMVTSGWLDTLERYSHSALINNSLFPLSIIVGLPVVVYAFRESKYNLAVAASPCFAQTLSQQSWVISLLAIVKSTPELVAAVIGLWLFALIVH